MGLFDTPQTFRNPRYVSHRGFTPLAPENSLPGFWYAGSLGQWAIETDVHMTKDGVLVCCHDDSVDKMYNGTGRIQEINWAELSRLRLKTGNRLGCCSAENLGMPLFKEYLAICKKFMSVPFIELKTDDAQPVMQQVLQAGFTEDEVVMSSISLSRLMDARKVAKGLFVHHIFGDDAGLAQLASLGNSGMSWKVNDPMEQPMELIKKTHDMGVKVCLRAADSVEAVKSMLALDLDYLPTNCMHGCKG